MLQAAASSCELQQAAARRAQHARREAARPAQRTFHAVAPLEHAGAGLRVQLDRARIRSVQPHRQPRLGADGAREGVAGQLGDAPRHHPLLLLLLCRCVTTSVVVVPACCGCLPCPVEGSGIHSQQVKAALVRPHRDADRPSRSSQSAGRIFTCAGVVVVCRGRPRPVQGRERTGREECGHVLEGPFAAAPQADCAVLCGGE